jgi:hypothetical protein
VQVPPATATRIEFKSTETPRPDRTVKVKPDPQVLLEQIRKSNAVIIQSSDDHEKASAWLALQEAEEELLPILPNAPSETCYDPHSAKVLLGCPGREIVEEAQAEGADIGYCGSGESWIEGTHGYKEYLKLWPDGSKADRAFWKTAVEPPCCDECSPSDDSGISNVMKNYSAFLEKFPNSSLKGDAERKLQEYENLLKNQDSVKR